MAVPEITEHLELDNAVAEMHDELYRMVDFDELDSLDEAVASYDKLREYMEGFRNYLTNRINAKEQEENEDGSIRTSSADQDSGTVSADRNSGGLSPASGTRRSGKRAQPGDVPPSVRKTRSPRNSDT